MPGSVDLRTTLRAGSWLPPPHACSNHLPAGRGGGGAQRRRRGLIEAPRRAGRNHTAALRVSGSRGLDALGGAGPGEHDATLNRRGACGLQNDLYELVGGTQAVLFVDDHPEALGVER